MQLVERRFGKHLKPLLHGGREKLLGLVDISFTEIEVLLRLQEPAEGNGHWSFAVDLPGVERPDLLSTTDADNQH